VHEGLLEIVAKDVVCSMPHHPVDAAVGMKARGAKAAATRQSLANPDEYCKLAPVSIDTPGPDCLF
jgi:hypothetical protein